MRRSLDKFYNFACEARLGISTRGTRSVGVDDAHRYATEGYPHIRNVLGSLDLKSDDVFVDLGCGMGRVVCCAAAYPLRKVLGVEVDPALAESARRNARIMRTRRSPVTILHMLAQDYDFAEGTVVYMFNPFGADTLKMVMCNIAEACRRRNCTILIVYVNPIHDEVIRIVDGTESLCKLGLKTGLGFQHQTSIWRVTGRK